MTPDEKYAICFSALVAYIEVVESVSRETAAHRALHMIDMGTAAFLARTTPKSQLVH